MQDMTQDESCSQLLKDLSDIVEDFDRVLLEEFGVNDSFESVSMGVCTDFFPGASSSSMRSNAMHKDSEINDVSSQSSSSRFINDEDCDSDDDDFGIGTDRSESAGTVFERIIESGVFARAFAAAECTSTPKFSKKKKHKKKTAASPSVEGIRAQASQKDLSNDTICDDFLNLMSTGLNILAASNLGGARSVTIKIENGKVCWGIPGAKPSVSTSISNIFSVSDGLPSKIIKLYSAEDNLRAFTMQFEGMGTKKQVAAFLGPSALERDALVRGFRVLIEKRACAFVTDNA